ncbi:protein of unknown function (DUF1854) [Abditibacterium utsteinense]|uniref:DUF1854 domain-containing protein n=1 Tax=Abditibacterium utsteinense TaxID=1960156 RepID=A0A2S8SVI8_9BACT|nr:DUF1854 domain-containing protein [Abditibacterium utsteinense]PQV64800.1 protein of unknown function (DUF1854) [Abditibacterium utsteinense]
MDTTHFLPPQKMKICRRDGHLILKMDGQKLPLLAPKRALPHTNPDEYILLCDADGTEIGVLRALHELEPDSRELLQNALEESYRTTPILKILDVEREPLSGQIRWRVEVEAFGDDILPLPESKISPLRVLRRSKNERDDFEPETPRHEQTFFIAGAEDVQTARYPQIFLTDVEGNRYEVSDCEALDLNSRRVSQQYF